MREKLPDISPEQYYGVDEVKAPEGWEFTGRWVNINTCPEMTPCLSVSAGVLFTITSYGSRDVPVLRLELRKKPVRWVPAKGESYWSAVCGYVTSDIRGAHSDFTEPVWKTKEHAEEFRAALNKLADEFQNRFYGEGK